MHYYVFMEMDCETTKGGGTGSGSCSMEVFGITGVEYFGAAIYCQRNKYGVLVK
jgi:hypothetical protein